ncbi:MAG: hypothetical protein BGN92_09710 [Sphingobacteriales bacterium 41-5]|nr:MAG: hypothetical protein BGN92_09710 [Sphingobacteriales bacterium 41-5]
MKFKITIVAAILSALFVSCETNTKPRQPAESQEQKASQVQSNLFHKSQSPQEILKHLLAGEVDAKNNVVKWNATPADIHELNGAFIEKPVLYTTVDTSFKVKRESDTLYYVIFRTAPMITDEEGNFVNSNSCHVCGVNLGYFSYTIENDSIYLNNFKRNFATHGSFGSKTYTLSFVNLGDGYELLRVDDPYEGMGTESISTRFYADGELMLSMISRENNGGNREENEKGYYEFKTDYIYNNANHTITVKQSGYSIVEKTGKKAFTNKTRKFVYDNNTMQF